MAASLLQVPVEHLQHLVALPPGPQTQPKELLHLGAREGARHTGWYCQTYWGMAGWECGSGATAGSLGAQVGRGWWYLQILGSPLHAPTVALQGRLALLCGHPMHHGLQLGTPTHPSAPCGPSPPFSTPEAQPHGSPSGPCQLAARPLAHPQGSPSVATEKWSLGLPSGCLGCCCWWRSWPWGLGRPGAWAGQWRWGQREQGYWVGATGGAQAGAPAPRGSGPRVGNAGSVPGRVGAQAAGSSGCC